MIASLSNSATPRREAHSHPDERHPTQFVVEGRDMQTRTWRRIVIDADDKNAAVEDATDRGLNVELVREADPQERPKTGIEAPQREFGMGGRASVATMLAGILSIVIAILMRNTSPPFAVVVGILGGVITLYGLVATIVFWLLSHAERD